MPVKWASVSLVLMVLVRVAIVVAVFVLGYRYFGLAVGLMASLALVVLLGPTVILYTALKRDPQGRAWSKLTDVLLRVLLPAALVLLVASVFTKLPGLIILCTFTTLMAGMVSLMMWAVRQGSRE